MRAAAAVLLAAGSVAGCAELALPYAADEGDRVTLTVQIDERLDAGQAHAAKELRFALDGRVGSDGVVEARIIWLELDHGSGNRMRTVTSGVEGEVALSDADTLELARTRLLDAMRDRTVRFRIQPETGLAELEGLTAAFKDAWRDALAPQSGNDLVASAVDDAALPLEVWLADGELLEMLRASGLAAIPPRLLEQYGSDERAVPVWMPGRGNTVMRVEGRTGESGDGRPAVKLEGQGSPDLVFDGDGGPAPPPEIGLPDPASILVQVETEYVQKTLRPVRGHVDVSFTYESGYRVRRSTGFTLVIAP